MNPELSSPAFTRPFKLLALILVAGLSSWFWQLWQNGLVFGNDKHNGSNGLIWMLCALALMLYTLVCIYRSTTTLAAGTLSQTWMTNKRVALVEIAYAKLIRVRGLDWLIAPRLYVRTLTGKFTVFYAADPAMMAAFSRIVESKKWGL